MYPEIAYVAVGSLLPFTLVGAPSHGLAHAVMPWMVPAASLPREDRHGWDIACNPQ